MWDGKVFSMWNKPSQARGGPGLLTTESPPHDTGQGQTRHDAHHLFPNEHITPSKVICNSKLCAHRSAWLKRPWNHTVSWLLCNLERQTAQQSGIRSLRGGSVGRIRSRVCAYIVCIHTVLGRGITGGGNLLTKQTPSTERQRVCVWCVTVCCIVCVCESEKDAQMYITTYTHKHIFTPRPPPLHSLTSLLCQSESWAHWHLNCCKHNMFKESVLIITKCVSDWVHNLHSHAHTNGAEDLVCATSWPRILKVWVLILTQGSLSWIDFLKVSSVFLVC